MKKKIKILYGLEAADGGSLKHLTYIVTNLNRKIFDVTVIISTKRSNRVYTDIKKMENVAAKVVIIDMVRPINFLEDIKSFYKIFTYIHSNHFDIVHAHSSKAGALFRIAAWLNRVPSIIYTPHCFFYRSLTGFKKRLFVWLEKVLGFVTNNIIVAQNEKECAINHGIVPHKKLVNINNAIKFDEYTFSSDNYEVKKRFGIKENSIVIGAIGRLSKQKDWPTFIYAARELVKEFENTIFLIIGDGELLDELESLIEDYDLKRNIIITGQVDNISEIYSILDIFVNTSLWEGLPYVILEAMTFKKPVITTNINYKNIVYNEQNGYIVNVQDYLKLVEKISFLMKNIHCLRKMGENGFQVVNRNFTFQSFIVKHENLYKSLVYNKYSNIVS